MRTAARDRDRGWRTRPLFSVRGRATITTVAVSALILALALVLLMLLARDYVLNRVYRQTEETEERVVTDVVRGRGADPLVSDASHDLRNPIAGLQARLELLLDEPADHDWKPAIRAALRDAGRLNDIVSDLLELSRLDARAPVPVEPVDLAGLVRREVARRTPRVPITTRLAPDAVVRANPVRLARVLGNLLSNAERHAATRIEVTVARDADDAVVEVLDDGEGVPADSRERVFERFARLSASRDRDPQGTGLGLPIAREIAEIHGGTLRILDSPRGARFVPRLPAD